MLGAIAGDIIGSPYEARPVGSYRFPLFSPRSTFTDDTVLTVATADALMHGGDYAEAYRRYYRRYPHAGYGGRFRQWAASPNAGPYGSFGNGSAMRVSPIGWAFDDLKAVLAEAERTAAVTHNHPEGIKGAQAVAAAVFLARTGESKAAIREAVAGRFGYDLDRTVEAIRPGYGFDVSCQGSVPESLVAFLESEDYEGAVRRAIWLGGDADTMACIAGAVAEAFYGLPETIAAETRARLQTDLLQVVEAFAAWQTASR